MNKIKLISLIAVGLLISNLLLAGFIMFRRPPHPPHDGPRNIIIDKLHFDEAQVKAYDVMIKGHQDSIRQAQDNIRSLKNELYSLLPAGTNNTGKDSLIEQLGALQIKIENIHYHHFEDIKKLCHEDQQIAFADLTKEIAALFAPHPPKHDRKR